MRKFILIALMLGIGLLMFGCEMPVATPDADQAQQVQQAQSLRESNAQIGMPAIKNFQERRLMKLILELRDQENLVTYAYLVNHMTGRLVFIGKCVGYGLPYATQYTNPQKIAEKNSYQSGSYAILPQADPNGLFSPASAAGTWLMMIDGKSGTPRPVYIEPEVIVSPFPLQ